MNIKKLLWIDFVLGFISGALGIFLTNFFQKLFLIPNGIILLISAVTLLYSFFAFYLASQPVTNRKLVKVLIAANWIWALTSFYFVYKYFPLASIIGKCYLLLQIIVVGGLAYIEMKFIKK